MREYLKLKKSNCKNCYKCIRNCPIKAISFENNQALIVYDECIMCGKCFVVCPQNAKLIRDDLTLAKSFLLGNSEIYISIAPSFVANYDGVSITAIDEACKKLGLTGAEETSYGATIVKKRYEEMVANQEKDIIITSCCHSVNTLIQKYYPDLLPNLADVLSPMLAHGAKLKKEHPGCKTIFVGPCISKKAEADEYPGYIDCVLTFEEFSNWLAENNIELDKTIKDCSEKGKTRIFPTTGGVIASMDKIESDYTFITLDGVENCMQALEDIRNGNLTKCFIEMSACVGSCIGGPVMDKQKRRHIIRDYVEVSRYKGNIDHNIEQPSSNELYKLIKPKDVYLPKPSEEVLKQILKDMGKESEADELNCGSCGYDTCREKAIAVYQRKANISMCLPFLKEKAESFSDTIIGSSPNGIIVLNENLDIQLINKSACKILKIKDPKDVIGMSSVSILDPRNYLQAMNGEEVREKRSYLAEYQKYIEETIIYDKNYHILMCVMRDVTKEELQHERKEEMSRKTIEVTNKVIEKQMRVVQEIASLLGETTAETKIALTKLKETLKDE